MVEPNETEKTNHLDTEISTQTPSEQSETAKEPTSSFNDYSLAPEIISAINEMNFISPTEVQRQTISLALGGRDLLVQSRTGSGKTAAFAIPLVNQLLLGAMSGAERVNDKALILLPTRELAIQVAAEINRISAHTPLKAVAIYGGTAIGPQIGELKEGAPLIVGTPGRIMDHLERGNLDTDNIHYLVLDEGDEMLSMGFVEEMEKIISALPTNRQSMLFSATLPEEIQRLAKKYLKDPTRILLSADFVGVREITHAYYLVSGGDRPGDLLRVLECEDVGFALIFCNTRDDTAMVADYLRQKGFNAEGISSDLTQKDRERVMNRMRCGELRFLVATDIAARGIDLADLTHVINYTFPESADVYIHRTGRTGRAGKSGTAISLVAPRELGSFYYLKLIHKIFPEQRNLPSAEELATIREGHRFTRLSERYQNQDPGEELRGLARRVWSTLEGERLIALALSTVLDEKIVSEHSSKEAAGTPATLEKIDEQQAIKRDVRRDSRRDGRDGRRNESRTDGRNGRRDDYREDRRNSRRDNRRDNRRDEHPSRQQFADARPAHPEGRKITRSRRPSADSPTATFVTADGDVEHWETFDSSSAPSPKISPTDNSSARTDRKNTARVFINIGRRQGAKPTELQQFIRQEVQAEESASIFVQMNDNHSYICVAPEMTTTIIEGLTGKNYKNRTLRVELAKK